jgi:nucleotide-binding universal stress UspA family protein
VGDTKQANKSLAQAQDYLKEVGAAAEFFTEEGAIEAAILSCSQMVQADFLIMGGFAYGPLRARFLGSTANRILVEYDKPVLICR